jgi:hypothetical protein
MVQDGINAVMRAEMWEYMAKPTTPGKDGFMFCTDPEMDVINKKIQYGGHSGSSFGWTMRQVEYIAKNGFDAYVDKTKGLPPPRAPTPVPVVMPLVEVLPVHNRANTGGAMEFVSALAAHRNVDLPEKAVGATREQMLAETSTNMSLDDQLRSLAKFSDVPMTYSEMRERYG